MKEFSWRSGCSHALALAITLLAWAPVAGAAPPPTAAVGRGADHARIVAYWTAARRAAAIPRDFVLDARGRAYLRLPNGLLQPYGLTVAAGAAAAAGAMEPRAKPGGGDTVPPVVTGLDPAADATIGASYTFKATVTDNVALRSVKFYVQQGDARAQSFKAVLTDSDVWAVTLQGLTDGSWSWWVVATDKAGNTTPSNVVVFRVDTGGGSSGGGVVTNAEWPGGGDVQTAAGRLYFEMPANKSLRHWQGYVCSGTVITDGETDRSIILTAAHCVYDDSNKAFARNVMFIPDQADTEASGTDLNCGNDPLGCWTPTFGVVDQNWTSRTFPDNIAWDYGYYVVSNSDDAHQQGFNTTSDVLDVAAGNLGVNFVSAPVHDGSDNAYTWAFGYSYNEDPKLMYCAENVTTTGSVNWWLASCGLSGGSSGGPWFQPFSGSPQGTGTIVSVNSWGYTNQPGMAGPELDRDDSTAECVYGQALAISLVGIWDGVAAGDAGRAVTCP